MTEKEDGTKATPAAFQVIILGSGGGPIEDNVTALLVRSTSTAWSKNSILAVDAGVHLSAVTKIIHDNLHSAQPKDRSSGQSAAQRTNSSVSHVIVPKKPNGIIPSTSSTSSTSNQQQTGGSLSRHLTTGPFAGLELPHETAKANAIHFVRNLITTYLITHPHLDHISGFVINTAGFQHTSRPKRVAGLPPTIDAFKSHVFNDVLWPNLSDEDGGVGLVSYMRLAEGGNLAIGQGEGRGYIEVCDGLAVKSWSISHGKCMHNHGKRRGSMSSTLAGNAQSILDAAPYPDSLPYSRRTSQSTTGPVQLQHSHSHQHQHQHQHHSHQQQIQQLQQQRDLSSSPAAYATDSSAFFLRDESTGHEILIFGDVEPDSLSLSPRTRRVWQDAAPKISAGLLKGVFIECSYDESQPDEMLFGHLSPRHIIAELQVLAQEVLAYQVDEAGELSSSLKRKRMSASGFTLPWLGNGIMGDDQLINSSGQGSHRVNSRTPSSSFANLHKTRRTISQTSNNLYDSNTSDVADRVNEHASPRQKANQFSSSEREDLRPSTNSLEQTPDKPTLTHDTNDAHDDRPVTRAQKGRPLEGLRVIIIHVKDQLADGPAAGETILAQLEEYKSEAGLACDFVISETGTSVWL